MKSEFTTDMRRPLRVPGFRSYIVPLIVPLGFFLAVAPFAFTPLRTVFSQSGRGQQPESKKQTPDKPKLPGPTPKIRVPENLPQKKGKGGKESEDTIRINSENLRDLAAERALETLTGETGGEVLKSKLPLGQNGLRNGEETDDLSLKELDRAFGALAEQLRTQYVLGFFSTNEKRDGSFRKLSVRIKKPGYIARARTGYYAPKE